MILDVDALFSTTRWVVDAEGFVDSGKTAHSRQSALEASLNVTSPSLALARHIC